MGIIVINNTENIGALTARRRWVDQQQKRCLIRFLCSVFFCTYCQKRGCRGMCLITAGPRGHTDRGM